MRFLIDTNIFVYAVIDRDLLDCDRSMRCKDIKTLLIT